MADARRFLIAYSLHVGNVSRPAGILDSVVGAVKPPPQEIAVDVTMNVAQAVLVINGRKIMALKPGRWWLKARQGLA